jgi:hypothetical protein
VKCQNLQREKENRRVVTVYFNKDLFMAIFYLTKLALTNLKRGAVKKKYFHAIDFV